MFPNPLEPFLQLFFILARRAPWRFTLGLLIAFGVTALLIVFDASNVEATLAGGSPLMAKLSRVYTLGFILARVIAVGLSLVGLAALILATVHRVQGDKQRTP